MTRAISVSLPRAGEPRPRTFGALRRFRVTVLRLRALASLLLALERRRIAIPRLRTTPINVGLQQGFAPGEMGFNDKTVFVRYPKRMSEQRFYEFPKLDCLFCSGAVPVIAIPLAFRRAAPFGSRAEDARAGCRRCGSNPTYRAARSCQVRPDGLLGKDMLYEQSSIRGGENAG
jgi:hypothetical protein